MQFVRSLTSGFSLKRLPWVLLGGALLLALIGALFIASTRSAAVAERQIIFLALGIAVFFGVALLDYRQLPACSVVLYAGGLFALALLPILGKPVNNAWRWYDLGPIRAQPSEPMKYVMVLALATYFRYSTRRDRIRDLAPPLILTLAPVMLVAIQPDLGSAMLFVPTFLVMAFLAGVPVRNLALLILAAALLAAAAWLTPGLIKDYQRQRLTSFIDPDLDPGSFASEHARAATRAVRSGGVLGKGWGQGRQSRRVPECHTDFIFPVVAEEWGFIPTTALIVLYLLVVVLLAGIAGRASDPYGALIAGGVMSVFASQALLHMAVSLRLAPITGLTLPLVSYGGSSLVSTLGGLALAASVAMRKTTDLSVIPPEA